ncbi:MAG: hypothetical protein QOF60_2460 [Actinomycetota bacterium]|jgi:hypothetical protein|nr:hypothetical protein [Actinomycetota bacterium]
MIRWARLGVVLGCVMASLVVALPARAQESPDTTTDVIGEPLTIERPAATPTTVTPPARATEVLGVQVRRRPAALATTGFDPFELMVLGIGLLAIGNVFTWAATRRSRPVPS